MKIVTLFLSLLCSFCCMAETTPSRASLIDLLGVMPEKQPLQIDTLETVKLDNGIRHKIKYFIEPGNSKLNTPDDWGFAYLFIPYSAKMHKTPALVAIHQDDVYYHIGKSEPAGLMGDSTMYYGKELFDRGYVVICPDRYYHADRRRTCQNWGDISEADAERDLLSQLKRNGVLLSEGRNSWGKEAYDLSRAVDVLLTLPEVDHENIGAIGHSAGANVMSYFVFYDTRIKAAVANCGTSEINSYFNYNRPGAMFGSIALPNSVRLGIDTHNYIAKIAPRSLFIIQGAHQWGDGTPDPNDENTKEELATFEKSYLEENNGKDITTLLFEENGGRHSFPAGVKGQVYKWLDERLK
jgi:dienelactone hydrolase